jgi:hypothetical protein
MAAGNKEKPPGRSDDLLDWFTVSYRSIYITMGVVLGLAGVGLVWYYLHRPPAPSPTTEATPVPATVSARLLELEGSVQVKRAGRLEWLGASREMVLTPGDLVRTGASATAEIHFFNGATVHMRPDCLFAIEEATEDPGSRRLLVTAALRSGAVNFETGAAASVAAATTISTPVSRTTAGADVEGNIAVAQTGESGIKVFRGEATTETNSGQRVALKSNEGVTVDAAGKPGPKVVLPPVPQLLAPSHQAELVYVDPSISTTLLAWKGVPSAATYHVMVDYSMSFARPLVEEGHWKFSSLELRGLEVGKYYWKVAAVDASGVEGNFAELARFSITKPAPGSEGTAALPILVLDVVEPSGNILHVKGRTEAGASLTVNGQRVDVQTDGSFNEWITLDTPGKQTVVVRATGIGGGVSEQKRPIVVPN